MATPQLTKSAKLYQERRQPQHRNTRRHPGMHHDFDMNAANHLELRAPFPTIETLHIENDKPPDAGRTDIWPWGLSGEKELV